jgi:hypothetical protein
MQVDGMRMEFTAVEWRALSTLSPEIMALLLRLRVATLDGGRWVARKSHKKKRRSWPLPAFSLFFLLLGLLEKLPEF